MPKTEAELRANKKYMDKFERMYIRLSPELKEKISQHADNNGESVNAFVLRAIDEAMEREK